MELKLSEVHEKILNEIDMLEFELDGCSDFIQRLSLATEIIKKLYFTQLLKVMIPVENQLTDRELGEFKSIFKEFSSKINTTAGALKTGAMVENDSIILDIIEKFIPYLKGLIKSITLYRKSKEIRINI